MSISSYNILLIEDNELNSMLLKRRLEKHDFNIWVQQDGHFLSVFLKQNHPDLILMDLALPGIDGLVLTQALKSSPQTAAIPIIAVSAYAMSGDKAKALTAGCDDYISKPVDFNLLLSKMEHLLKVNREKSTM